MTQHRTIDFRYAPKNVWTCIGRPDDPYKSLVREDGALLYKFNLNIPNAWRFDWVFEFALQTDQAPSAIQQETESARVPVVITRLTYPKANLTLQAFGHQHNGDHRTDIVLWRIEAGPSITDFMTGLWLTAHAPAEYFAPATIAPGHHIYVADERTRPSINFWASVDKHWVEPPDAQPLGPLVLVAQPQQLRTVAAKGFVPASGLATPPVLVSANTSVTGALFFPQNHSQVDPFDEAWAQAAMAAEQKFWQGASLQPLALEIPDEGIADMLTACARNILQAREIEDGLPVYKVGPTVYRGLFVVDGHFFLEAAQYLGFADQAAQGVETLLRRAKEDGSINIIPNHLKETGIALATLARQTELSGNWAGLRQRWPVIQKAVQYIQQLRRQAYQLDPADPAYGLMPAAYSDGGVGGKRPEYSTPLWTLAGLKAIAQAARQLDLIEDVAAFQTEFDRLLADFRAHVVQHLGHLPNGLPYLPIRIPGGSSDHHWIPDYPAEPEPWQRLNPGSATWALAQTIYPGEVFAPDDLLVQNFCQLLELLDDEEGIPIETGWLPYRALWTYAASFYAHVWLYAGRPDKAVDYLYAFANHAAQTRVWREEQSLRETQHGQLFGDMPHNWASAEFIRLVRHLLVFERGLELELLRGLPAEWIIPEKRVYLEKTPTRFGPVSLEFALNRAGNVTITVQLASDWPVQPQAIRLYLPQNIIANSVRLDGAPAAVKEAGNYMVLPSLAQSRIQLQLI
jgi:hypothetical protein